MHPTTYAILRYLQQTDPIPPSLSEIAAAVRLAWPSSVVRHLDKLEKYGLIERQPGKARNITLTPAGRRYREK